MSYIHIENLYRPYAQQVLLFKEVFVMEKIHGTSAHIAWKDGSVRLFSGGERAERFAELFNIDDLADKFKALGHESVIVYGEAYGGKCQGMSKTYGDKLCFISFEVKIGDTWLNVENAFDVVVNKLHLEFVPYRKVPANIEELNCWRDFSSIVAVRRGISEPRISEGIVIRPLVEMVNSRGERVMAKHKRAEFSERASIPDVDPTKRKMMEDAESIALEWVTDMRLSHVLDAIGNPTDMKDTGVVIKAMVEDVCREASGEIRDSQAARKAIGGRAAKLYKERITRIPA